MSEPGYRYPMERSSRRDLAGYEGPIDIWDIDKTYLLTEFERLRDLLARAFETALDKQTRPGAAPLLKGLRAGREGGAPARPLYFVSASPPQLRPVLEEKMALDGIVVDGIAFKDHWRLIRKGRLRDVKRHVPYKLAALLEYRAEWPTGAREWLVGDDAESDPRIYSLYAEIRAGKLSGEALAVRLEALHVGEPDREALCALAARANEASPPPEGGSVEAIYIFQQGPAPRADLAELERVEVVQDALALAMALCDRGRIDAAVVDAVRAEVEAARPGGQAALDDD